MRDRVRAHAFISGHVQGVFFRESTRRLAESLDVAGWVRNLADGRVEAVFEGDRDRVERMIRWCERGPAGAEVHEVVVDWEPYAAEFDEFRVLRG